MWAPEILSALFTNPHHPADVRDSPLSTEMCKNKGSLGEQKNEDGEVMQEQGDQAVS